MKRKFIATLLLGALCSSLMIGCGAKKEENNDNKVQNEEKKEIILGGLPTFLDYLSFLPEKMEEKGYKIETIAFDDFVAPNNALVEGSIDANFYQHKPYLDAYNKSNDTNLYACEPYIMASYDSLISKKYKTLDELPDGAKIAISDDPSNLSANLHSLEFLGLIKLKEIPEDSYYTVFDVIENPHNLEFVEVSMASKYTVLDDVDAALVFHNNSASKKYDFNIIKVLEDDPVVAFPVIVAIDGKNKDEQWVKDLMDAITGKEMEEVIEGLNTPTKVWRTLFNE